MSTSLKVTATTNAIKNVQIPPHSSEAEQALLGGLMRSDKAWDDVADLVNTHDFYRHEHRVIFDAIAALANAHKPRDLVTVGDRLQQQKLLEDTGDLAYLTSLIDETVSVANITEYAKIVREHAILRRLIEVSDEIARDAYFPQGRDSKIILDKSESLIFQIADSRERLGVGFQPIDRVMLHTLEYIQSAYENKQPITGIATGYNKLDHMTSGLQKSDLIIVAGRPSMGKSALAMNIAEHVAMNKTDAVAVFSMEMPAEQLAMRTLASLGRVPLQKLRTGDLQERDWARITGTAQMLTERNNLFIDDSPSLTPMELRARARRIKRQHSSGNLALIVVDYLQLMQVTHSSENRAVEVSEITRSLKALAKELSVPVVALSQLNRSLEQRHDKRPILSDLRESGAIEQDADLILLIYRDEVYDEHSEDKGVAEIQIGKQRNGPTGRVKLTFIGEIARFENMSSQDGYGLASST